MNNKLNFDLTDRYKDSIVLVAGAGGTIGSGLVRSLNAKKIIAVDISEYAIYKLQREAKEHVHCIVGDISDPRIINLIFEKYKIDYVFNAAAYKHVDTMEDDNNVYSVVKNNILGVINLCNYLDRGVKGFVHISSDKAVNPTNYMGYTKLWCERIVQYYEDIARDTQIAVVRFGNVYNSAGSFVETLEWQMKNNLPITVTDDRMKRYFITIDDAVALVSNILDVSSGNHTYVLDMGEEVSIPELIKSLAGDYPVKTIGIRPGEKLTEELFFENEEQHETSHPMIKKISWRAVDMRPAISTMLIELSKPKICTENLIEILQTTTIL